MDPHSINTKDLQEDLIRTRKELEILYEVSNAMRTTLELNKILYIILTGVTSHAGLGFNRAVLFLVNKKDNCLEPRMAIGPDSGEDAQKIWKYITESKQDLDDLIEEDRLEENVDRSSTLLRSLKGLKIPLDNKDTLLGNAFHSGIPAHIEKDQIHQFTNDPLLKTFKTNELVIMPLKAKDNVNGLIIADNLFTQKPISEDELKIFMMLANQAGLAIENSQLYEMVIYKSHTDSITELWNHGFFQNQLNEELELAKFKKRPVSLLIIDIDSFKKLNDTFGHQNGDIILKEIANILKRSSRDGDYPCRYGGEEFSIILPNTPKEQAFVIAERIRENVSSHSFSKFTSEQPLKITLSIGLATYPEHSTTKEDLIAKADKAMYIAKFGGKNQTCVAS